MGDYVQLSEVRDWIGIDDSYDDLKLSTVVDTAERCVDEHCGRTFTQDAAVSARWVEALTWSSVLLPYDISTTTGLVVASDFDGDGTAETTWTIDVDFDLYPYGGVGPDGRTGWPYTEIRVRPAVFGQWFPPCGRSVQVTAKWGWPAVPAPVKHATLLMAHELFRLKDAPFGVAGFGDLGLIRVRDNPKVASLLSRFVHARNAAAIA